MLGLLSVTCHPGSDMMGTAQIGKQSISVSRASTNKKSTIFLGTNIIQFHTFLHLLTGSKEKKQQQPKPIIVRKISACTLCKESYENDIGGLQKAQQISITEVGGNMFTELLADSYLQFKESVIDQTIVSSPLTKVFSTLRQIPKNNQ